VQYDIIILRYGEIWLKATETKKRFEQILIKNIKNALNQTTSLENITRNRGRIYLKTPYITESISILQKIFGLTTISPAIVTTSDLESISTKALTIAREVITKNTSFALRVTRTGGHPYTSQQVAQQIGQQIVQQHHAPVNLTSPDIELFIEIRDKHAYLFLEKIQGTGGLPYGTQGTVAALVDTSYSLLAAWYLMRRGCNIHFILTDPALYDKVKKFMNTWYIDTSIYTLSTLDDKEKELSMILKNIKSHALVVDHFLGQKKSNILTQLTYLKQKIDLPLLTPLIAMSEEEIEAKAQLVGLTL
jgi:thiamine biosynthesis protein ThiI